MEVKEKLGKGRSLVVSLMQIRDKPKVKLIAGYVLNFILGFAMTNSLVMTNLAPFGIAIVGRASADWEGVSCLLGACLGYITLGGFDWGIRYVATITLVFTVAFVFKDTRVYKKAWFMPTAVSIITALTAFLNTFEFLDNFPSIVSVFSEVTLAGAGTYFFSIALKPQKTGTEATERRQAISISFSAHVC